MPLIPLRKSKPTPVGTAPVVPSQLRLHELRSRIFRNSRLLRVWLPAEYEARGTKRYPVLYLNDGQNLFDPATAFAGVAWRVGETAARLISEKKIPALIIVGIDNTGENRIREYIPYHSADPPLPRALGTRYPDFLLREVMPLLEKNYRVDKGPEHTGLGGSSLGGLITLYTQLAIPGVFGRLLVESPSLFVADRKNSRRVPQLSRLAVPRLSRNWNKGSGKSGERREGGTGRAGTGENPARRGVAEESAQGTNRRGSTAQRRCVGGAVSGGAGVFVCRRRVAGGRGRVSALGLWLFALVSQLSAISGAELNWMFFVRDVEF